MFVLFISRENGVIEVINEENYLFTRHKYFYLWQILGINIIKAYSTFTYVHCHEVCGTCFFQKHVTYSSIYACSLLFCLHTMFWALWSQIRIKRYFTSAFKYTIYSSLGDCCCVVVLCTSQVSSNFFLVYLFILRGGLHNTNDTDVPKSYLP